MGMTMTQKILAAHAGLDSVAAGQLINAKLDIVLGNELPLQSTNSKKQDSIKFLIKTEWRLFLTTLFPIKI